MANIVRRFNNIAAATTVANAMAGDRFEFLRLAAHVALYAVCHDAGTQTVAAIFDGDVTATLSFGNVILIDNGVIPASIALRRNEHLVGAGVAPGGDRLIFSITNNDGVAAADVVWVLEITDL